MRHELKFLLITALLLSTTTCSRDDQGQQHQAMDGMATKGAATGPIKATGIIRDLDLTAGTVTVEHDPIAALGWGAMTMRFTTASPEMLKDLSTGDSISFDLESPAKPRIITRIEKL